MDLSRGTSNARRTLARSLLGGLLVATATLAVPGNASAGEPEKAPAPSADRSGGDRAVCADSYKNAQISRKNGALRRAREALLVCASDRCPAVLQPDCMRWLTEVEAAMPTMTFAAKGVDGKDVSDVRVTMDGQPMTMSLDGKALPIDPGTHQLRFEHGSEAPIDQQIVVREGEKSRVVSVSWARAAVLADPADADAPAAHRSHTAAWVVSGVGAAALVTFGVLAIHGVTRRSDLQNECFGHCEQSKIDSIKTEFAIADIALGVGIVSVGVATVLFLTGGSSEKAQAAPVSLGVAPQKNGAALGLSGRF
ncbi:MAG: hypothetical protein JWP97_5434 [Labilithrix sp.]|nr:hypothetical protein [Labilithrix sp.]